MINYELIQELINYPPGTKIIFKCNDPNEIDFRDCDFRYKKILNELHIELY